MPSNKELQAEIAERLQLKWLERMERLIDEGAITSTDMATLVKTLKDWGWTLDPARLPKGLASKLTEKIDPADFEDDGDVIPISRRG